MFSRLILSFSPITSKAESIEATSSEYQPYNDYSYRDVVAYASPPVVEEDEYYEETSECRDDRDCIEGETCNNGKCKSESLNVFY